jgi:glycosyltransferase involved in cell wall biosynthesis
MQKVILAIPVYNEEKILENSITQLIIYFNDNINYDWRIIIANNGSTDKTQQIVESLAQKNNRIIALDIKEKGRGNALKCAWGGFEADIYAYCDVDLATDIRHLSELFEQIRAGNDIAIGSRYLKTSLSKRTLIRLIMSKVYNFLIRIFFKTKITDFQCGFKAINNKVKKEILPLIRDKEWFWDTELLLVAELNNFKIKEIPVSWQENRETKVKFFKTICDYLKNLFKLKLILKNYALSKK